eukprot:926574-Pelagomonas_calceolata.AAC.3
MRGNGEVRSSTTPVRQLHEVNAHNRRILDRRKKTGEDTRPGAQLLALVKASQQQHHDMIVLCPSNFEVPNTWQNGQHQSHCP